MIGEYPRHLLARWVLFLSGRPSLTLTEMAETRVRFCLRAGYDPATGELEEEFAREEGRHGRGECGFAGCRREFERERQRVLAGIAADPGRGRPPGVLPSVHRKRVEEARRRGEETETET